MDYPKEILLNVVGASSGFGSGLRSHEWWAASHCQNDHRIRPPAYQIKNYGIEYRPAEWLNRPLSPAERQGFSRAVVDLESSGTLEAIRAARGRVTHIRPTTKGLLVALRLAPGADLDAIRRTLEIAAWSTPEHLAAIDAQEAISDE